MPKRANSEEIIILKKKVAALEKALYEAVMPKISTLELSGKHSRKKNTKTLYENYPNNSGNNEGAFRKESEEDFFLSPLFCDIDD